MKLGWYFWVFVSLILGCSPMKTTVQTMLDASGEPTKKVVTEEMLQALPEPVQAYLRYTQIVGKKVISTVRLKQAGDFRLKPKQSFKTMRAVQYFNVDSQEFYWQGKVSGVTATDCFIKGKGRLTVKLLGLFKVADAKGPQVDQGELLRFLAEGVWFPSIYADSTIRWQSLGKRKARASIVKNGISVSADFYFNEQHQVERICAKRYMERDGAFELRDWEIRIGDYQTFDDVRIPVRADVIWKLEEGDFCWYKPRILEIHYNVNTLFD